MLFTPVCSEISLNIVGLFDFEAKNHSWNFDGVLQAVKEAFKHINDNKEILPEVELRLHVYSTKVCCELQRIIKL